jgi:hypothetical protein
VTPQWLPDNHESERAGPRRRVDELAADGPAHGWTLLFPDRHPYAGGPDHYAAYLASTDNFEVELVASGSLGSVKRKIVTQAKESA